MIERFTIPGQPVAKGRPRFARRGNFVMAYTPAKTARWEAGAAAVVREARGALPARTEPLKVTVEAVAKRPKRLERKADDPHRLWRPARPEIDNVCKAALDALMLAGAIKDDAQVVYLVATSWYSAKGEGPSVSIQVETAPGVEPAATWYSPGS